MAQIAAFGVIVVYGAMSPGPDLVVVVRRSAVSGRGHGMAAAAGVAVGAFAWAVAAAGGVGELLFGAFTAVKVAGAAYLFFLGARSLWRAWRGSEALRLDAPARDGRGSWAAFTEGLLTTVLDWKAALFFMALVPQFLGGDVSVPTLGVVALVSTIAWFLLVACLVGLLHEVFAIPLIRRAVDGLAGVTLIGLGTVLAFTRP
ncbi:threonine/homoserine/homoserine lactone efflux protein [Nonomuraea thailandensis]|uniref:Threonine/homoserine/homoserine lactone efflux protein n=1 Tax=Nonomuraea thailandensis TaxID=1188745 RepID=A0A9X2K416_9ACTN|nr:LysE family transporter [Nonomuraea thailandensis]MCP2358780.1 threonine/homoserine/homoserine lactone efflux protein [Nonomuraea thailandensis]